METVRKFSGGFAVTGARQIEQFVEFSARALVRIFVSPCPSEVEERFRADLHSVIHAPTLSLAEVSGEKGTRGRPLNGVGLERSERDQASAASAAS